MISRLASALGLRRLVGWAGGIALLLALAALGAWVAKARWRTRRLEAEASHARAVEADAKLQGTRAGVLDAIAVSHAADQRMIAARKVLADLEAKRDELEHRLVNRTPQEVEDVALKLGLCLLLCAVVAHAEPPGSRVRWTTCPTPAAFAALAGSGGVVAMDDTRWSFAVGRLESCEGERDSAHAALVAADAKHTALTVEIEALHRHVAALEFERDTMRTDLEAARRVVLKIPEPRRRAWKYVAIGALSFTGGVLASEANR